MRKERGEKKHLHEVAMVTVCRLPGRCCARARASFVYRRASVRVSEKVRQRCKFRQSEN